MTHTHTTHHPPGSLSEDTPPLLTGLALRRGLTRASLQYGFPASDDFMVALEVAELRQMAERLGHHAEIDLATQIAAAVATATETPCIGYEGSGRLLFVLRSCDEPHDLLHNLAQQLVDTEFEVGAARVRPSPAVSYVALSPAASFDDRREWLLDGLREARRRDDLHPIRHRPGGRRRRLRRGGALVRSRLGALFGWLTTPAQIAAAFVISVALPFLCYAALERVGLDITPAIYVGTVVFLLITSYLIWYEGFQAFRSPQPPEQPGAPYPPASAIIAAYLPNEAATIVETVRVFLTLDYPGELEVILAYNTPDDLPVEGELRSLAASDPRLRLLRVVESTSKAQNVNAALMGARGAFVGIFDADHHPAADSFTRAWRWLSNGYDAVQGHCVIRNGADSWVARMVAVEFETIYAVAHPGRARLHGFGIFGGSNGYWRTDVLRRMRMRSTMLTEDIDASLRATIAGHQIATDPLLVSRELAPPTLRALWNQRLRWAQGWLQVSLAHTWPALRSPDLSLRKKLGVFHLLVWRELYPWVVVQIITVLGFWIWRYGPGYIDWLVPIFVLTTLLTFSSGPIQVLLAYLLGAPEIRRQRGWYLFYLVAMFAFYNALKNLICQLAVLKELMRERKWKVTPRVVRPGLARAGGDS